MGKIQIMNEILANKIAAGEVVEKIASAVKELVENSIDAKSTEIKIELIESGIRQIRVTDNGIGMSKEDAPMAFLRHATSKLLTETDLYRINTLGFRGEALPSIASVSKVSLKTSTGGIGTHLLIEGGVLKYQKSGDERVGTIMEINDLFYNTPARLKYIRNLYTELGNISDYVNKIALSNPYIKFILKNNDKLLLQTDGRGNLLKTISDVYGVDVARKMIKITGATNDYEINGFISYPEVNRSNKNHIITLVKGRVVKNFELMKTINDAYHSYKPDNRYPIVVINIDCDPSLIDVNIHPTKMDIKFSKMQYLKEELTNIIRKEISRRNLIPKIQAAPKVEVEQISVPMLNLEPVNTQFESSLFSKDTDDSLFNEPILFVNDEFTDYVEQDTLERMPAMYPVGLVHGTYIIAQNEIGMYLIDQHAAKERINYEIVKKAMGKPNKDSISMLIPLTLEFTTEETLIINANIDFIRDLNIGIEEFGINSFVIKKHPIWIPKGNENEALRKILELIISIEKDFNIEKFNERISTMMSCKMSIKANTNITLPEMQMLINDLRKCDNPFNCPHGRPTTITYSVAELEKLFKRSGFESLK